MATLCSAGASLAGLSTRRSCCCLLRRTGQMNLSKFGALSTPQVAYLRTVTQEEPLDRLKPSPFKSDRFGIIKQFMDRTEKRFNENSKVIVVDGNLAIDKTDIAQKIAKEFDLLYVPSPHFDEAFFHEEAEWDEREDDERLPTTAKAWDLKRFYTDPHPQRSRVALTQISLLINRFLQYATSLHHLLSTGQGVVLNRSVFSDYVFADTMRKFDYFSRNGLKHYYQMRDDSICELMKPHLIIYLDAPISMVRDGIKKRNIPYEVNSKVLSDEYLQSISDVYKNKFLPEMRPSGEVMTFDLREGFDFEYLVERLEKVDLETEPEEFPFRFEDWTDQREDTMAHYRRLYGDEWQMKNLFRQCLPWDAPELLLKDSDLQAHIHVVQQNRRLDHAKGHDRETGQVLFRW